jgi:uncharacterized membrane-anchored protein YhcB (DUF1043 family)
MQTAPQNQNSAAAVGAEISDYVAHLQLHMALQARNLVPNTLETGDKLQDLLHETQAQCEKLSSRQGREFNK